MAINPFDQCPRCGQDSLIYDGMLVWRSGPRPPRESARKKVGFSSRSDYERERIYHCGECGVEYWADADRRTPHLHEEGAPRRYTYDKDNQGWTIRSRR